MIILMEDVMIKKIRNKGTGFASRMGLDATNKGIKESLKKSVRQIVRKEIKEEISTEDNIVIIF